MDVSEVRTIKVESGPPAGKMEIPAAKHLYGDVLKPHGKSKFCNVAANCL